MDPSLYETCTAEYSSDDIKDLIKCVSEKSEERLKSMASGVDTFYLLFAGALVYFMQLGFAMLCAGSIRSKNVKNVLLWNLLDSCGGAIGFWAFGYAFAYGGDDPSKGKTFIGNTNFFLMNDDGKLHIWFFQFAFACALSSIVAGTIAERCKMSAYLFYSTFLAGFVYPVVAHSFWSVNGFLANGSVTDNPLLGVGAIDLAGSGPVHMTGGVTALVMAVILGPRKGRFYDDKGVALLEPKEFTSHSAALQFLGTFALWFGWYGFNPGSTITISNDSQGNVAALAAVNTTLAASSAAISAMFTSTLIEYRISGRYTWDTTATMNGCLTGLVAVTAGCATVEPWAGFIIGIFAGWFYLAGSALLLKLKIDDAVDAIPVHMVGGMWGVIATGLFTAPRRLETAFGMTKHVGWFYSLGDFTLLGVQLISCLWIIAWTSATMGIYVWVLNMFGMLRVDPLDEERGMDISVHGGPAYNLDEQKDLKEPPQAL